MGWGRKVRTGGGGSKNSIKADTKKIKEKEIVGNFFLVHFLNSSWKFD
jgi:hypothetical protein